MSDLYAIFAVALPLAALAGSVVTLALLFQKHIAGQPLLPHEPRRPVPWNALAPAIILAPTLLAVANGLLSTPPLTTPIETVDDVAAAAAAAGAAATGAPAIAWLAYAADAAGRAAWSLTNDMGVELTSVWSMAGALVLLTVVCHIVLAAVWRATREDLGWSISWGQLRRDVAVGATTCLALFAPVYAIQFFVLQFVEQPEGHPLLEQLQVDPSGAVLLAATVTAVIAAPLFEETAFRLVFQGWMERIASIVRTAHHEPASTGEGLTAPAPVAIDQPAWMAIVISGTLFALAHYGQSAAPVSLLPLGLALGYVYQRTHRIVPTIVCHALFNGFSMLVAWLFVKASADLIPS